MENAEKKELNTENPASPEETGKSETAEKADSAEKGDASEKTETEEKGDASKTDRISDAVSARSAKNKEFLENMRKASKKKRKKHIILITIMIVLALAGAAAWIIIRFYNNIKDRYVMEAGNPLPGVDAFLQVPWDSVEIKTDMKAIQTTDLGEHTIELSWGPLQATSKLIIQDTTAPAGKTEDKVLKLGEKLEAKDFLVYMQDATKIDVSFVNPPDFTKEVVTTVGIELKDQGGNKTLLTADLTIYDEKNVPVIKGTENKNVYVGESISYRAGVTVEDALDSNPELTIDNSKVDLDTPGIYQVTYTATDFVDRSSSASISVHVNEKPANYEDTEKMYTLADDILKKEIKPNMSEIEKAFAIFRWVRLEIPWIGTGSHDNDVDQAIRAMEGESGDCFTHALVCKILLEREGFVCMLIEKITDTGTHYWLKVQINGNWFNMDPSPIYIRQFVPFLSTDAQLKEYADKWRPGLYALELDPYPPAVTESPADVVYKDEDYIMTLR